MLKLSRKLGVVVVKNRRFIQCDVFTSIPTKGNALAVVVDGEGLTDIQLQEFAAWTNLAETTFLLPPTSPAADYRVRIFTTTREMLFAGHPTLGSCAAWLHTGGKPRDSRIVRQECAVGIVDIDISGSVPAFVAPPTAIETLPQADMQSIVDALGLDHKTIAHTARLDNGPVWQVFALNSAADVLAVDAQAVRSPGPQSIGLIGPHSADAECDFEVRMLSFYNGTTEDPITGSLNSALAHWMISRGELHHNIVVSQGTCINRLGRVYISPDPSIDGRVLIGGMTHILIEGSVTL